MSENKFRDDPTTKAQELYSFLEGLPQRIPLKPHQQKALDNNVKTLDNFIATLAEAISKDDWRNIWEMVKFIRRSFGGYVGDELGQELNLKLGAGL